MAEATADEIDEMGYGVTATAKKMLDSAHERRRHASGKSDLARELDLQIAEIEEDTAVRLEFSEETMHSLADLKRKVDGE